MKLLRRLLGIVSDVQKSGGPGEAHAMVEPSSQSQPRGAELTAGSQLLRDSATISQCQIFATRVFCSAGVHRAPVCGLLLAGLLAVRSAALPAEQWVSGYLSASLRLVSAISTMPICQGGLGLSRGRGLFPVAVREGWP